MEVTINTHGNPLPSNNDGKGEYYDLCTAERVEMKKWEYRKISLGISVKVPKGYIVKIYPRSSTFERYGIIMVNSAGIIDSSYCGNDDIVMFPALALGDVTIEKGTRIAQMTVEKAEDITFTEVDMMEDGNRGGFGSTGA